MFTYEVQKGTNITITLINVQINVKTAITTRPWGLYTYTADNYKIDY